MTFHKQVLFFLLLGMAWAGVASAQTDPSKLQSDSSDQPTVSSPLGFETLPHIDNLPNQIAESSTIENKPTPLNDEKKLSLDRNSSLATWLKLAATGRHQYEIEAMLHTQNSAYIDTLKANLRHALLDELRLRQFARLVKEAEEPSDFQDLAHLVSSIVRSFGLEADTELPRLIAATFHYDPSY